MDRNSPKIKENKCKNSKCVDGFVSTFLTLESLTFAATTILYFIVSVLICTKIYYTAPMIIDEEFHLPQGMQYCNLNFSTWDPKITTFPGLYFISMLLLKPFEYCSYYGLRLTNVIGSTVNLMLFFYVLRMNDSQDSKWKAIIQSVNLAILPPLYFFSHVYYTDVWSITFFLLSYIVYQSERHPLIIIVGGVAVLMRQTNIVWVVILGGTYALTQLLYSFKSSKKLKGNQTDLTLVDLWNVAMYPERLFKIFQLPLKVWRNIMSYGTVFLAFVAFVLFNGSIVVGDKNAHTFVIHLPQLFYFSIFFLVFSWPHTLRIIPSLFRFNYQRLMVFVFLLIIFELLVHFNTFEHPYLLADNRHYTFYVWNRLYRKIPYFRYIIVPVYIFAFYCIVNLTYNKDNIRFLLMFAPALLCSVALAKLIEIRYFFPPFAILRLNLKNVPNYALVLEFLWYALLNILTFKVFFETDVYWSDYSYAQKIIW